MEQKRTEQMRAYYRIKTTWTSLQDDGCVSKTKTEELIYALNYTDAEATANAIAKDQERDMYGDVSIEIIKTKIDNFTPNDVLLKENENLNGYICYFFSQDDAETGLGLYAVQLKLYLDRENKKNTLIQTEYIPAYSASDAVSRVSKLYQNYDYVIRGAKFDPIAAIYVPA